MWTPVPASALRTAGRVAVSVLPSPVFISAIEPSWRTIPPISWTSKWRWPSVRRAASRVSANASGRRSSRLLQLRRPLLELFVTVELELGLEVVDPRDALLELLELLAFAHAKCAIEDRH